MLDVLQSAFTVHSVYCLLVLTLFIGAASSAKRQSFAVKPQLAYEIITDLPYMLVK